MGHVLGGKGGLDRLRVPAADPSHSPSPRVTLSCHVLFGSGDGRGVLRHISKSPISPFKGEAGGKQNP